MNEFVKRTTKALVLVVVIVFVQCNTPLVQGFQQQTPSVILSSASRLTQPRSSSSINDFRTARALVVGSIRTRDRSKRTCLSVSPLVSAIGSPLGSVGVLALVVLVHEAGHYLAAKSLGISVEEFSVGVGPRLLGFEAWGNEFNLRALPLGGYVRFPENYNASQVMELQEAAMEQQMIQQETNEDATQENGALMSGLMNVLTFGRYERKRAEEEAKRLAKLKEQEEEEARNNRNWLRNWFSANKPESVERQRQQERPQSSSLEIEYYDDPDLLQNRPWPQRALVLSGGVLFNLLLAFFIFFGEINVGSGLPKPVFDQGALVSSLPRIESPSHGKLEPGDVIVKLNGSPLSMTQSPNGPAAQQAITDFITKIRETPEGDSLSLSVLRKDAQTPVDVVVQPKRATLDGPQSIGVMLRPNYKENISLKSDSIPQAAKLAFTSVVELTQETTNGLLAFFGQYASGKGAPPGQSVSGPIGLIRTGSSVVSSSDLTAILTFAAAISVNLAVVNSLPLPALDGGQMIFVICEAITGRKVDQRLQEGITSVALVFLLLLSFSTTIGDVESIIRSSR